MTATAGSGSPISLGAESKSAVARPEPTVLAPSRVEFASKQESGIVGGSGNATAAVQAREMEEHAPEVVEKKIVVAAVAPSSVDRDESERTDANGNTNIEASGVTPEQVAEIKAGIQAQQKFIAELVERASRWELEGSELRIYFSPENSTYAGLLEGRDTLEKIRGIANRVLGRAVRVCARLDSSGANAGNAQRAAGGTQELRAQFENDPIVKSMLQRFGGRISEVRRQKE